MLQTGMCDLVDGLDSVGDSERAQVLQTLNQNQVRTLFAPSLSFSSSSWCSALLTAAILADHGQGLPQHDRRRTQRPWIHLRRQAFGMRLPKIQPASLLLLDAKFLSRARMFSCR